eukprot:g3435.t1
MQDADAAESAHPAAIAKRKSRDEGRCIPSPPEIHVLVVDDDPLTLLVLETMFKACFYRVTTAGSGEDALRIISNEKIDLVLVDMRMPVLSGDQLTEMLNDREPELPVIVMSSSEERESVGKCVSNGAVSYLVKPLEMRVVKSIWQYVWKSNRDAKHRAEAQGLMHSLHLSGAGDTEQKSDKKRAVEEKRWERADTGAALMDVGPGDGAGPGTWDGAAPGPSSGSGVGGSAAAGGGSPEHLLVFTWNCASDVLHVGPDEATRALVGSGGDRERLERLGAWAVLVDDADRRAFAWFMTTLAGPAASAALQAPAEAGVPVLDGGAPARVTYAMRGAHTQAGTVHVEHVGSRGEDGIVRGFVRRINHNGAAAAAAALAPALPLPQGSSSAVFAPRSLAVRERTSPELGRFLRSAPGSSSSSAGATKGLLSFMCEWLPNIIVALSNDGTLLATNRAAQAQGMVTGHSFFAHPLCHQHGMGVWRWKAHLDDVLAGSQVRFDMTCVGGLDGAPRSSELARESTSLMVTMAPLRVEHKVRVVVVEVCDITSALNDTALGAGARAGASAWQASLAAGAGASMNQMAALLATAGQGGGGVLPNSALAPAAQAVASGALGEDHCATLVGLPSLVVDHYLWRDGNVEAMKLDGHRKRVYCTRFVGGAAHVYSHSLLLTCSADGSIKVWDRAGSIMQWVWPSGLQGSSVICADMLRCHKRILAVQRLGAINMWDAGSARQWTAQLPSTLVGRLEEAQLYHDSRSLLTLGDDGVAHEWLLEHPSGSADEPAQPSSSGPSGLVAASAQPSSMDGSGQGQTPGQMRSRHIRTYRGMDGQRLTAAVASDWSQLVAVATQDSAVHFIDYERGQIVRSFRGHTSRVRCLKMQYNFEDGLNGLAGPSSLFSAGHDKTVRLWDMRMHGHSGAAGDSAVVLRGHEGIVHAISTFGEYCLISGGSDNTILCWDVRKQQ